MPEILSTIKVLAYYLIAKNLKVLIRCLLQTYMLNGTPSSLQHLTQEAERRFAMMFEMTSVWNY